MSCSPLLAWASHFLEIFNIRLGNVGSVGLKSRMVGRNQGKGTKSSQDGDQLWVEAHE